MSLGRGDVYRSQGRGADKRRHSQPRRTEIIYEHQRLSEPEPEEEIPDYPVTAFLSREGYFKKITPASLRMNSEQKYKEGDGGWLEWECTNRDELLVFTDKQQCYKSRLSDFDAAKPSVLAHYMTTTLALEPGENVVWA